MANTKRKVDLYIEGKSGKEKPFAHVTRAVKGQLEDIFKGGVTVEKVQVNKINEKDIRITVNYLKHTGRGKYTMKNGIFTEIRQEV